MEKLKIGSNTFDLIPMGISEDTIRKTRSFIFVSGLSYSEIIGIVSGTVTEVQHIGNDGNTIKAYADIVAFKGLGYYRDVIIGDGATADVYTVTYSVDAIEREINTLKTQLTASNKQIDDLSNTIVIISMGNVM